MEYKKNISLRKLNTFGIDVKCKLYCKVKSVEEVISVINSEEYKNNSHLILSGGSNVLFLKGYFENKDLTTSTVLSVEPSSETITS